MPEPDYLHHFRGDDLVISTTRYYLGRMTAITGVFAQQLAVAWPDLPPGVRDIIRRDIQAKFDVDDRARGRMDDDPLPLGMDCDRGMWELVRDAWMALDQLIAARNRLEDSMDDDE